MLRFHRTAGFLVHNSITMGVMGTPLTRETIRQAPKALLHDHLDGGLRPSTVIDIARQVGYDGRPAPMRGSWRNGFARQRTADRWCATWSRSRHTVAVMQTPDALHRVAQRSAWPISPTTTSCMPKCASRPSCTSTAGCPWMRWSTRWQASPMASVRRGARAGHHGALPGERHAARRTLARYRRTGHPVSGQGCGRLRHCGRGGSRNSPSRHLDAFEYMRSTTHGSPFTPGRRSGWSTRRWPSAARTGATVFASSMTSPPTHHRRRHRRR